MNEICETLKFIFLIITITLENICTESLQTTRRGTHNNSHTHGGQKISKMNLETKEMYVTHTKYCKPFADL